MEEKSSTEGLAATPRYLERLKAFVGEPSSRQTDVIKQLCGDHESIIMHNMPGTMAVHCYGILQRCELKNNLCLVVVPHVAYMFEIVAMMKELDPESCVKVEACHTITLHNKSSSEKLDVDVAVGTPRLAFNMVKKGLYSQIGMVLFYFGNEVIDDITARQASIMVGTVFGIIREFQSKVQGVFFSERALCRKSLDWLKHCFANVNIITSSECIQKLGLEGIQKHEYRYVTEEEKSKQIELNIASSRAHTIIYVDFCSECHGDTKVFCINSCGFSRLVGFFHGREITYHKKYVEVILDNTTLLIFPSRIWAREIISRFADKVHMIINYSYVDCCEYLKRLGPFQNVSTAITLATKPELVRLDHLQLRCGFKFDKNEVLSKEVDKPDVILCASHFKEGPKGEEHMNKRHNSTQQNLCLLFNKA